MCRDVYYMISVLFRSKAQILSIRQLHKSQNDFLVIVWQKDSLSAKSNFFSEGIFSHWTKTGIADFLYRFQLYSHNFKITMTAKMQILTLLLLFSASAQIVTTFNQQTGTLVLPSLLPCVAYKNAQCVSCPYNYHIGQNQCYLNITNCLTYTINSTGMEVCSQCDSSKATLDGKGTCTSRQGSLTGYLSSDGTSADQVAANYGDNRFVIIPLSTAQKDPYFIICNNYMMNGQYKHFISRTAQPIASVAYFASGGQNQYKILYNGSGGGLMMCIISITLASNAIQLSSFVPIGVTNVIDNCGQYDLSLNCIQCASGWHLQGSICYLNIEGCVSYSRNICLMCLGYAILVENMCVTCTYMGDLNKIQFFGQLAFWVNTNAVPQYSQSYLLAV